MRGDNTLQGSSCLEDSTPPEHLAPDVMQSWWASIGAIGGSFLILYCRLQLFSWLSYWWLSVAPLLGLHIAHLLNWPEKAGQNPDFVRSDWGMKCLPCSFHELALKAFSCYQVPKSNGWVLKVCTCIHYSNMCMTLLSNCSSVATVNMWLKYPFLYSQKHR